MVQDQFKVTQQELGDVRCTLLLCNPNGVQQSIVIPSGNAPDHLGQAGDGKRLLRVDYGAIEVHLHTGDGQLKAELSLSGTRFAIQFRYSPVPDFDFSRQIVQRGAPERDPRSMLRFPLDSP